jgi:hypothetical protein
MVFLTSIVAEEQTQVDGQQEKGLEHIVADDIEAIEISISVERASDDFNKDLWEQIISDGKKLIGLCEEKGFRNEIEKDYFFINELGAFIEKYFPLVSEDTSSIDGYLSINLLGNHVDMEVLDNSEWTKVIGNDVEIEDAKKITLNFLVQRYKNCAQSIWQDIFDTARDYALRWKDAIREECENLVAQFKIVLQKIYDLSKGTKDDHVDIHVGVVNKVKID